MLHPSTKRLIDKLNDMTRKQRVAWTESDDGSVTHDTEGYRVILTPEPHAIFLTDALGRQIETCTPDEFADETDAAGRPYAKFVAELFREAHRHARGTEKAIRTLLETLDAAAADVAALPPAVTAPAMSLMDAAEATEDLIDEMAPIEGEQAMTDAVASLAEQINNAAPASDPAMHTPPEAPLAEPVPETAMAAAPRDEVLPEMPVQDDPARNEEPPAPASAGTAYGGGFFGAYGGIGQYSGPPEAAPAASPVADVPQPSPVPEPPPAASDRPVPVTGQRISLSSIPYGFGLGAVSPPVAADPLPAAPEPVAPPPPAAPLRMIDGTVDLPDAALETGAGWVVREQPREADLDTAFRSPARETADDEPPGPDAPAPDPAASPVRKFNPWN